MIITICLRKNYQQALYRKKPRTANITGLCLMCWNIALGAGVMLGRLTQFLLAAAFWIGRTDAQFLDEDVKVSSARFLESTAYLFEYRALRTTSNQPLCSNRSFLDMDSIKLQSISARISSSQRHIAILIWTELADYI